MANILTFKKFSEIDLNDSFFDSLKRDYPGNDLVPSFEKWFNEKAKEGRRALIFNDNHGLGAFICIKSEEESIILKSGTLPKIPRTKISTIKIAEQKQGQRFGEGAIGLVLQSWQKSNNEEIYVTVFEKHRNLIEQLEKFGFLNVGKNENGESVLLRSKNNIDYSDPYKSFPFINPNFQEAGYLIINDNYHDTMFPYSELKNVNQNSILTSVSNGITKIYVGKQITPPIYKIGEPIFIYRKFQGKNPGFKSCITSFCTVTKIIEVKRGGKSIITFDELLNKIGNKSVFDINELKKFYSNYNNMYVIEMVYNGYFGKGNNINYNTLKNENLWSEQGQYPTQKRLTKQEFEKILKMGGIDVDDIIIN